MPDVEVKFEFNNVRHFPAHSGYRTSHLVKEGCMATGVHYYYDVDLARPGEYVYGTISFLTPEQYPHCMYAGKKIPIFEGAKVVGYATVLKILNPLLATEVKSLNKNIISFEDALFYKILLRAGDKKLYSRWLDQLLEENESPSDDVFELAYYRDNINRSISLLHNLCLGQVIDHQIVLDKMWITLNYYYVNKEYSVERLIEFMKRIGEVLKEEGFESEDTVYSMCYMDILYEEAEDGIITKESFSRAFEDFMLYREGLADFYKREKKFVQNIRTLKYVKNIRVLLSIYVISSFLPDVLFLLSNIFDNRFLFEIADLFMRLMIINPVTVIMLIMSVLGISSYIQERKNQEYKNYIGKKWLWCIFCYAIQIFIFFTALVFMVAITGGV